MLDSGDHVDEFKKLKPEEREKKLNEIIRSEIDNDKDGFVSEEELRDRFRKTTRTHRQREVEDTLKYHDESKNNFTITLQLIDIGCVLERYFHSY